MAISAETMNVDRSTASALAQISSPSGRGSSITISHNILNNRIMAAPRRTVNPLLSQSVVLPQRTSLIDNTLAQACSTKRARDESGRSAVDDGHQLPQLKRSRSDECVFGLTTHVNINSTPNLPKSVDDVCPYAFIESVLVNDNGDSSEHQEQKQKQMQPLHELEFITPTEEQILAYNSEAIAAVRACDIEALRAIHSAGRTLRCCNRFGESLLHVACRRASAEVVSFLLNEANVSPRIRDDYGRTPLHDACWRGSPEYDIVEMLLSAEPRLAFVKDVRGHRPFQYARREHWGAWREFLDRRRQLILP